MVEVLEDDVHRGESLAGEAAFRQRLLVAVHDVDRVLNEFEG